MIIITERLDDRAADTLLTRRDRVDSLKFTTPKGKIVYGGGGIIPDVYVPYDANFNSDIVEFLKISGFMDFFVFEHLDGQRDQYFSFSEAEFLSTFEISKEIYQQFETIFHKTTKLENDEVRYARRVYKNTFEIGFCKTTFWRQYSGKSNEFF